MEKMEKMEESLGNKLPNLGKFRALGPGLGPLGEVPRSSVTVTPATMEHWNLF